MLFAELPRVRLDRIRRPSKLFFDAPSTLSEVPEECEGYLDASQADDSSQHDFEHRLDFNTTLRSPLGKRFLMFCLVFCLPKSVNGRKTGQTMIVQD